MDALQSFLFLQENLPIWISKLSELSRQVAERHIEFTRLSQTSSSDSIRRKNTASTESLRPNAALDVERSPFVLPDPPISPLRIQINPSSKHFFRDYREEKLKRKRKSGSMLSSASGQRRYRSRMSVIVYYDSAIQDGFELLVRQISSARNSLRKGKTAASFKARMLSLHMEESPFGAEGTIQLRNPNIPRFPRCHKGPFITEGDDNDAFDQADKDLEAAQGLCEVGAHQFLRDGDCLEEIAGTKECFESCLQVVKRQVANLQAQEQKEKEEEERQKWIEQTYEKPHVDVTEVHMSPAQHKIQTGDVVSTYTGPLGSPNAMVGLETIEVDDDASETSSVHIDLTAFRSTRRLDRGPS